MPEESIRGRFRYNKETGQLEPVVKEKKVINAPAVHGDEVLDGIHSMLDDKKYYSKSGYRNHIEANNYKVTGGDHLQDQARDRAELERHYGSDQHERDIRDAAEKAYYDIKYDRVQYTEKEKQLHIEEERKWKSQRG